MKLKLLSKLLKTKKSSYRASKAFAAKDFSTLKKPSLKMGKVAKTLVATGGAGLVVGHTTGYLHSQPGLRSEGAKEGRRQGVALGLLMGGSFLKKKQLLGAGKIIFRRIKGRIIPIRAK